ncbi:kinase-like domain-containing protein [Aspergillus sergii]|uniref:Kinase-like domain-containing protein n=1 Tax=Aspergillus sergii TaxID=1034303 RepID=A0A5N6XBY3_9EURO|nr:kinase-like domain-containing protein [Aspergillus sergii]
MDETTESDFIKYGSPYMQMHRVFIGLEPTWGEIYAVEFTENSPVSYIKKLDVVRDKLPIDALTQTSHANLVNLREVFVAETSLFFVYEKWGISLKEMQHLSPVFRFGEVEIATLCREVLEGLKYIHKTLGISHGSLSEGNIYITDNGGVKIANIGQCMLRGVRLEGMRRDISDVCNLARALLGPSDAPAT